MMKRVLLILLALLMLLACACNGAKTGEGNAAPGAPEETADAASPAPDTRETYTITIQSENNTITGWISSEDTDATLFNLDDLGICQVRLDVNGNAQSMAVHFPLPAAVTADSVASARLRLTQAEGADVSAITATAISHTWTFAELSWENFAEGVTGAPSRAGQVDEGAYVLDITDIVKAWLAGDCANYGVLLQKTVPGNGASFYTGFGMELTQFPALEVEVFKPEAEVRYAKFDYTPQEEGNCFSYALRDLAPVYYDTLITDTPEFQRTYDAGGLEAALQYMKEACFNYIEANKEALGIESFRELTGFDDAIDASTEYRVALRIGFRERNGADGIQVAEDFDYHLKAQTADGGWAEKTPGEASRQSPGANALVDPGKFPWDESFMWGYEKWNDFYDSGTVYFAVTKPGEAFTRHISAQEQA
ncbi:MAG: DNRLRE domain-containing protein [Christensenellaceae bacterium]|nr:DNRLRE domain-containing protein [Christensenellaceae bacterium]